MRREPWDWPPRRGRRFRKVEVLPPEQPRRIEISIRRHRPELAQRLIIAAAIAFMVLMVLRAPMGVLVLAALVGPQTLAALAFGLLVCVIAAAIERKAGRPF
jgi:hypothetical protein